MRSCGQYEDKESGLFYNRHRYYESDTGQYLSPDPLNLSGGFNPYSYVHNPVNWIDPLGLTGCSAPKKWDIDSYGNLRDSVKGKNLALDSHHVGQKAIMKDLVKNYDPKTGPSMLVPKVGHTVSKDGLGIVSRSRINPATGKEFINARSVIARDIKELRRVYPEIPNSKLKELINMNKNMYPEVRFK